MNNQNIASKLSPGFNKIDVNNLTQQASEGTNESSSEDDTEDSTDNKLQEKPKVSVQLRFSWLNFDTETNS